MRIRTIKPEFFLHEQLFSLEESTTLPVRLAYIGLWCIADREGRFKWEPRKIGVQILPYDGSDFAAIMNALASAGFLRRYGPNGEFGVIPSFPKHQCINQREAKSTLPAPVSDGEGDHMHAHASTCAAHHVPSGVNIPGSLSAEIMERDGNQCLRCGAISDLTTDHISPRSAGGTHAKANLRTLCRSCNSARPVQGQALFDDLRKDGLTMSDMGSMCMHVHARGEGKGREGKGREGKEYPHSPHPPIESPSTDGSGGDDGKRCLPAGWSKLSTVERKRVRVIANTPLMERIGKLFGRGSVTLWTIAEAVALKQANPSPDEVDLIAGYYSADLDPDQNDYRRRDIGTLLNNWTGEMDRARLWRLEHPDQ